MPKRKKPEKAPDLTHVVEWVDLATVPGLGREVYEVAAIMFHPHDAHARRTFVASATVDMMERLADLTTPRGRVVIEDKPRDVDILGVDRLLDEAVPSVFRRQGVGRTKGDGTHTGIFVAAEILQRALCLAEAGWPETGIEQVIFEQSEAYKRDGIIGSGRDNLTSIWQDFKASAHLALSFIEVGDKYRMMEDKRGFFEWTGRAMDLLRAGCEVSNRHGKPILSEAECWRIFMVPSVGG